MKTRRACKRVKARKARGKRKARKARKIFNALKELSHEGM